MPAITPNFSTEQFAAVSSDPMSVEAAGEMISTAYRLEDRRSAGGDVPLDLTSFYRTPEDNARVGGVDDSQHEYGRAVDYKPRGVDLEAWARKVIAVRRSGASAGWGQLILYYYTDGHVHESAPTAGGYLDSVAVLTNSNPKTYRAWDGLGPLPAWEGLPDVATTSGGVSLPVVLLLGVLALLIAFAIAKLAGG